MCHIMILFHNGSTTKAESRVKNNNGFPVKEKIKFRFDVHAFQDPPLCISTSSIYCTLHSTEYMSTDWRAR
jgi:hypothetical protein